MGLQTPRGVKDFLPEEAIWKQQIEGRLRDVFMHWGYQEVVTPTFEFYDTLDLGETTTEQTYRFLGRDGELLALRSDLTTPIARMVATRLKDLEKPLRLSYLANVFRYDEVQVGFQREFFQAGVELIGSTQPAADAEGIALAVEAFKAMGVQNFCVDIGQVQYLQGIMEECGCPTIMNQVRQVLIHQDFVGLKAILAQSNIDQDIKRILLDLPQLRGKADVFDRALALTHNDRAKQAVENLQSIYAVLEGYGVTDHIHIDFGMVKSLDYYTGMILEGYTPNLGSTLCSGGRYDNLSSKFGQPLPAVGFALGLERLMLVLERQGLRPADQGETYLVLPRHWPNALAHAQTLRQQGHRVEVDVQGLGVDEAVVYAKAKGISFVILVEDTDEKTVYRQE